MADKRVRISYGRTVQTAPYESLRLDVAIEKDVPESADLKKEVDASVDSLVGYIKNKIKFILDNE